MQQEENVAQWAGFWDETASDAVRTLDESRMAEKWNKVLINLVSRQTRKECRRGSERPLNFLKKRVSKSRCALPPSQYYCCFYFKGLGGSYGNECCWV